MKYISQLDYEHIPYYNNLNVEPTVSNVKKTGCGLCCLAMMLEHITTDSSSIEELVKLSEENDANRGRGTAMYILAPIIAERFGLNYSSTSDLDEVKAYLRAGGHVIAHVISKERGAVHGFFTKTGHFVSLISTDGDDFCYFDPSYTTEKFSTPERIGKVDASRFPFLYCNAELLHGERERAKACYHLFSRPIPPADGRSDK